MAIRISIDPVKVDSTRLIQGEIAKSAMGYQKEIRSVLFNRNMYADKKLELITDLVETFNVDKTYRGNKLQGLFDGFKPAYSFFKKALNADRAKDMLYDKARYENFRRMNESMGTIETIINAVRGQKDVEVIGELKKIFSKSSKEPSMNVVIKNRRYFVA